MMIEEKFLSTIRSNNTKSSAAEDPDFVENGEPKKHVFSCGTTGV
jgi:hypothetical protein